jgi:hypothetical protein
MTDEAIGDQAVEVKIKQVGERFKAFLALKYKGNQSIAAADLGISQPALSRVAAGDQLPSGKLLLALALNTDINLDCLFTGRGTIAIPNGGLGSGAGVFKTPVAHHPLPGPPDAHPDLLSGELLTGCGFGLRQGQYWLRIQPGEPISRAEGQNVRNNDLILLETDRSLFPEVKWIFEQLFVVRIMCRGMPQYRLAEVSNAGEGFLEADTFDLTLPPAKEIILRPMPGGKYVGRAHSPRLKPRSPPNFPRCPHGIRANDLIAMKVLTLSR